jgi:chemotaxis protein MotB
MASGQPIIIKKIKKAGHGHHGGAWKVAYADFVTAMMAFFLLMWLINSVDQEQLRGVADYFSPSTVSTDNTGSAPLRLMPPRGDEGVSSPDMAFLERNPTSHAPGSGSDETPDNGEGSPRDVARDALTSALARREQAEFESAEMSLRQALQEMPELAELSRHLIIDQTPEGLRIQLIDEEGRPMFDAGATRPNERAIVLLRAVADVVERLPNRITISGHTDASPVPPDAPSNWELSSARANAALRILQERGISDDRISDVRGKGSAEPLFPDDPYMAGNRRLSIVLLREAPVLPPGGAL